MERTVLKLLLDKAGLAADEQYKKLMEGDAADIPVTDAVGGAILAKLLTVDDAVKNTEVKKRLKPEILKDVDDKTVAVLVKAGLTEDDAKKIVEGKASPEKIDAVIEKLAALEKDKGKGTETEREKEWTKTRVALETERDAAKKEAADNAQAKADLQFGYDFRDFLTDKERAGLALGKSLPVDTQIRLIKEDMLNNQFAKDNSLTVAFRDGALRYLDKEGNVYHKPTETVAYDPRTELLSVTKKLGLVDAAPPKADEQRRVDMPPEQRKDETTARSIDTNRSLVESMIQAQPPTPTV